ncbi:hypothetical protein ON010_g13920 [Phytophthora cinnamomi]|nr:hypothetical protein ON010_g13920 [Phytophthora cinnamomi]
MPARIAATGPQLPTANTLSGSSTALTTVEKRLDALNARLSWFYVRLLLLMGVSWALRSAELVLFAFTRHLVASDIAMGTNAWEILSVGVYLGAALGGPLFGLLADFRGRRSALVLAMILSLAGLALSAVAKTDYQLIGARIIAGVGLGGELPAAIVLVQELSPKSMRGSMVAWLEAFAGVGGIVGVALAFGLAPTTGWTNAYLAVCACGLYVGVLRWAIPESPRWLASVGRVNAAFKVMEKLEQEHGVRPHYDTLEMQKAPKPADVEFVPSVAKAKPSAFDKSVPTLVIWALWTVMAVSSYALGVYVPTLISLTGFNIFGCVELRAVAPPRGDCGDLFRVIIAGGGVVLFAGVDYRKLPNCCASARDILVRRTARSHETLSRGIPVVSSLLSSPHCHDAARENSRHETSQAAPLEIIACTSPPSSSYQQGFTTLPSLSTRLLHQAMVSASFALLGALVLFTSTADGSRQFVQRLPNGGNVEGYQAIGHTDGTGNNQATNAFGDAFQKAGNKWSLGLCQADTDGDGQTNGQELGDPCCEWTQSSGNSPRWSSGVSHPSLKDSMSNASLWANINCSAVTTISATSGADSSLTVESATSMFALATGIALLFA